jgi:tetratricopeptide (TPR) repeat protein
MAKQAGSGPPDLQHVIAIMLRMADCQAQSSQTDKALQSYESAVRLAAQTKQSKLESLAAVNEAALQGRTGKTSEALRLYEHALELDGSIGDASASAQDWFSYGRFLSDNGYPAQFAYACFVKSQKLQDSLPNAAQQQLRTASISQTAKLVANAMAIRQDPQPTLARALALRY